MNYSKILKGLVFGLITLMLIISVASCAPQPAAEEPAAEEPAAEEPAAEKTSVPILIPDNPAEFHGYGAGTGFEEVISELVMLSVAEVDDQGNYFPELATEIPTVENGGVVMDEETWETTVTWHLRQDIYWEDGEQVTADDSPGMLYKPQRFGHQQQMQLNLW